MTDRKYIGIILVYNLPTLRTINIKRSNGKKVPLKARRRGYPAETITVTDYADDLALHANTPA